MKYFMVFFFAIAAQSASASAESTDKRADDLQSFMKIANLITDQPPNLMAIAVEWLSTEKQSRYLANQKYRSIYGNSLADHADKYLPMSFALAFRKWLVSDSELYTARLEAAMSGWGTDEDTIINTLVPLNNVELSVTKELYSILIGRQLKDDLIKATSGDFQILLTYIVAGRRNETSDVDWQLAAKDIMTGWHTQEGLFTILTTRSYPHLRAVFHWLGLKSTAKIQSIFSGRYTGYTRKCLIALVKVAQDKSGFFAEKIHEAIKKSMIQHLIFYIRSRYDKDLEEIKLSYLQKYGHSIIEDLQAHFDYDSRIFLEVVLSTSSMGLTNNSSNSDLAL